MIQAPMNADSKEKKAETRKEFEIISTPKRIRINLWFDDYDDIFSDFDPRGYSYRTISDDFLKELQKIAPEVKAEKFDLVFLVPVGKVDHVTEKIIKSRLHNHFHKEVLHFRSKLKGLMKRGILISLLGMVIMFLTVTFISIIEGKIFSNLLMVIFEPTGWFTLWYGLDHLFYLTKDKKEGLNFSQKMLLAEIEFGTYRI
jgi:hypothetical protein